MEAYWKAGVQSAVGALASPFPVESREGVSLHQLAREGDTDTLGRVLAATGKREARRRVNRLDENKVNTIQ